MWQLITEWRLEGGNSVTNSTVYIPGDSETDTDILKGESHHISFNNDPRLLPEP